LEREFRKLCRARKIAERRCCGEMIYRGKLVVKDACAVVSKMVISKRGAGYGLIRLNLSLWRRRKDDWMRTSSRYGEPGVTGSRRLFVY